MRPHNGHPDLLREDQDHATSLFDRGRSPVTNPVGVSRHVERVAGHWFRGWFVVHMWSVTLRILDSIIINYNDTVFSTIMSNGETAYMDTIVVNIVCVLMYFLVPSLTTYFVGHAATSGFFGKLAGVVATGAKVAAAGAGGAGVLAGAFSRSGSAGSTASGNTSAALISASPRGGGGGGGSPALPQGPPPPLALGPGGGYLLGGGSPVGLPPGGGPLPPLSGSNVASIPVRQLPLSPQPRPVPVRAPGYTPYEIVY